MTSLAPYLKPLSAGQIFDRGIRLYRNNFLTFIGIIAIMQIPIGLTFLILQLSIMNELPGIAVISGLIMLVVSAFLTQFGTAAITHAVADNYLGNPITIIGSYKQVGQSWWTLLGATFLLGLMIGAIFFISIIPFFIFQLCGWITAVPGFGFFIFFSVIVLPLIAPIVVLEKQRATSSIYRAWHLARRRFWWIFGFFLLLNIFNVLIVEGPSQLFAYLLTTAFSAQMRPETADFLPQILTALLSIIYLPLQMACVTLLYFDLRVRTEGLDLAILAAAGDDTDGGESDLSVLRAPEPNSGFDFTRNEFGYFCLITVGAAIIFGGLALILGGLTTLFLGAI